MKLFAIICGLTMLCLVHVSKVSSLITEHSCAYYNTAPQVPFDKTLMTGPWYIHQLNDFDSPFATSVNYDCYVQMQTARVDGNQDLVETLISRDQLVRIQLEGLLIFDQPEKGHFTYSSKRRNFTAEWDILETDYVNYAIEWVCYNLPEGGSESIAFVRIRDPVVLPTTKTKIDNVLDKYHIDKTQLRKTNPLSCPAEFLPQQGGGGLIGGLLELLFKLLG